MDFVLGVLCQLAGVRRAVAGVEGLLTKAGNRLLDGLEIVLQAPELRRQIVRRIHDTAPLFQGRGS